MGKVILPVLVLGISLLHADAALACTCEEYGIKSYGKLISYEYHRRSAAVFSGEVIELGNSRVRLKVEKVWKGGVGKEVALPHGGSSCYFGFKPGESYLVYAHLRREVLGTDVCTQTKRLAEAEKDVPILDKLRRKKVRREKR
jgi:hypothetical protein